MNRLGRREFVQLAAGVGSLCASGAPVAAQIGSSIASSALKLQSKQESFKPEEIELRDGLLRTRYELHRRRLKGIPPEDILMPFFRARGLPTSGKELNGDCLNNCQTGPGNWPGLQSTYWFSGAAATARWGRDEELRQTLVRMVNDLARTREPDGFLLASPTGINRWEDHYSLTSRTRSMIRGLVDIYEATGHPLALALARGQADSLWKEVKSRRVPEGTGYVRLGGSTNTKLTPLRHRITYLDFISSNFKLPPALALLYLHTGESRYAELAELCIDEFLVDRLAANAPNDDPLAGRHAYLTMDLLYGMHLLGQLTNNERYLTAAANAWKIIAERHVFVTGGMGSREVWVAGSQQWHLPETLNAQETCAAAHWIVFNHIMLEWSGEAGYADQIERTLFNDLLAAQDPLTGDVTYFLNLAGKDKLFDPPPRFGRHCCEGNHMFSLGSIPGMIYGRAGSTISVNLYVPSALKTQLASADRITLVQETAYPIDGEITMRVECARPAHFGIQFRIPSWCASQPRLAINGAPTPVTARAGEWQRIEREWSNGDRVRLDLPMGPYVLHNVLSTVPRVALRWGPLILAGTWEDGLALAENPKPSEYQLRSRVNVIPYVPSLPVKESDPGSVFRKKSGSGLSFEARGVPPAVLGPGLLSKELRISRPKGSWLTVQFLPFYEVTSGKYSIWFPTVIET